MRFRLLVAALSVSTLLPFVPAASAEPQEGAVYVASNEETGNRIVQFLRDEQGVLTAAGSFSTGGLGTGTGLGNQGGVVLTDDGQWLLVVNAGSNDISVFAVDSVSDSLRLADRKASRGHAAGGAANASSLTSYRFDDGALSVLAGPAPTNQTAACWAVATRSGRFAYTTNTGSGTVSGYSVDEDGTPTLLNSDGITAVAGKGPIDAGFSFGDRFLFVLNSGDHSISALSVGHDGSLRVVGTTPGLPPASNGLAAR